MREKFGITCNNAIYGKTQIYVYRAQCLSEFLIDSLWVEEIQRDATVCRYLFTAKLLYMFRAAIAPIIRSI